MTLDDHRRLQGAVLLDCDGVVVDNTVFERQVTRFLIRQLATERGTTETRASALWAEDLASTRHDWRWYDYSWHVSRLGLAPALVEQAHLESMHLLAEVPGIRQTIEFLRSLGLSVGIVTDATKWVVDFKLAQLGLGDLRPIVTSDTVRAVKSSATYWEEVSTLLSADGFQAVVDNRVENLLQAKTTLPNVVLIQFRRDEHVTQLPAKIRPMRRRDIGFASRVLSVNGHSSLRRTLQDCALSSVGDKSNAK